MLRVLDLTEAGVALSEASAETIGLPAAGTLRWVDLTAPSVEDLDLVGRAFGFHSLALDDCRRLDQRPKLEPYGNHLFVVMHRLVCELSPPKAHGVELHTFLGANYLVTVHEERLAEVENVMARLEREPEALKRGPDFWYYLLADRIVTASYVELESVADAIEDTEEHVLHGAQSDVVDRIFALKRLLSTARRLVSPERELFSSIAKWGAPLIKEQQVFYYRSIHDDLTRAVESIESYRELLSNALDAHFAAVSQRTNEIMKHLTLLSSIFLPLTFVTGFFGMNFEHLPFASDALMWAGIGACLLLPAGMLFWFRSNRWI
jgi:magnesium transporter